MARRQKGGSGSGVPEWLVTFADLMSILVCFFVLIISFSIQDKQKLQVVAGSMREAFGVKKESIKNGIIEIEGLPERDYLKRVTAIEKDVDTDFADQLHDKKRKQGPEANTHDIEKTEIERPRQFALAAASLRQALEELPDISEISDNVIVEETEEGLNIMLVDQDGRAMFNEGSKFPHETTRRLLAKIAPVVHSMPNRVRVTGHTTAGQATFDPNYSTWDLSADRANIARRILNEYGVPSDQFESVVGKADTEPLFPNDPFLASNRRVSILLMAEEPPIPIEHRP